MEKGLNKVFKEGMGISAEFDNDYSNLGEEIANQNMSDEQMYINFISFCKKHSVDPAHDQNVAILLTRIMETRPALQDGAYRKSILDKYRK